MKKIRIKLPLQFKDIGRLEEAVKEYVIDKFVGKCSLENGYITQINSVKIKDNIISRIQPVVLIDITLKYDNFDPKIEDVITDCNIIMMFEEGIWAEKQISDSITICIAIPKNNVKKVWDNATRKFEGLAVGDKINVKITNVNFDGTMKKYIGSLIE